MTAGGLPAVQVDVDLADELLQVFPPGDTAWRARRARLPDPEGGDWSFGNYG